LQGEKKDLNEGSVREELRTEDTRIKGVRPE